MGSIAKAAPWFKAARPRTLPLSVSGVLVGTGLANFYGENDVFIFILSLLTTVAFQVTSNLANDYGDGVKGTDNADRIGPARALQSGLISREELKRGIWISVIVDIVLVVALIYTAFRPQNILFASVFLVLGAASIWAAIKYTIGTSAYGYRGLGDLFVFIFFGWVAVLGTMFLHTKYMVMPALLPATTIGLLSVGVLNLNNLRDSVSDEKAGKRTLVVFLGFVNGKIYHYVLLILAFCCLLVFQILFFRGWRLFLPMIAFVPILYHLGTVYRTHNAEAIDPELKKLALSTFFLSVLVYINCNNFL